MLQRIISTGTHGVERAVLETAKAIGFLTGGQSRPVTAAPAMARRLGLSVDRCSTRQARLANARRADGTLIVGHVSDRLVRLSGPRVFVVVSPVIGTVGLLADGINRHDVRTLNIVGLSGNFDTVNAVWWVAELARRLGRRMPLPCPRGCQWVTKRGKLFATRLWPTPRAWRWDAGRGWVVYSQWRRVLELDSTGTVVDDAVASQTAARLVRTLPTTVRRAVFHGGRIDPDLLAGCARLPGPLLDLARAGRHGIVRLLAGGGAEILAIDRCDPAARHLPVIRIGHRVVRRWARDRQRDIVARFHFPAAEWAVRAVAKIPAPVDACGLMDLRSALSHPPAAAALAHVPVINRLVRWVVNDPTLLHAAAPSFLLELSKHADSWSAVDIEEEFCELTGRLRHRAVPRYSIRSFRDVRAILARLPGDPPPAIAAVRGRVEPLTTAAELRAEGVPMDHCVAGYADDVASGWRAIYRVVERSELGIDRATVMLGAERDRWVITQIAGRSNKPVSPMTRAWLDFWLAAAQADGPTRDAAELIIEDEMARFADASC
jgi:hypothetical protein